MKNYPRILIYIASCVIAMSSFAYDESDVLISDEHEVPVMETESELIETTSSPIQIPLSNRPKTNILKPKKSMSQTQVLKDFGAPMKKHPTKGKPPITRWDYRDFSVYFETDKVIHSVERSN